MKISAEAYTHDLDIALHYVACSGSEEVITECDIPHWGVAQGESCGNDKEVWLNCEDISTETSSTTTQIRKFSINYCYENMYLRLTDTIRISHVQFSIFFTWFWVSMLPVPNRLHENRLKPLLGPKTNTKWQLAKLKSVRVIGPWSQFYEVKILESQIRNQVASIIVTT